MSSKLKVFLMIPVLFMGMMPTLYEPLTKLVHAVVLLTGRVISERFRRDKGYVCEFCLLVRVVSMHHVIHTTSNRYRTCFNHVFQEDIVLSKSLIPEGLSEFERATPASSHKSHVHQIVHYPRCVDLLGSLSGQWMFGDERRNKVHAYFITHYISNTTLF